MTLTEVQALIENCKAAIARHQEFGLSGVPQIALKIYRKPAGETMRILPGITGRVVQWGNAEHPSVVMVEAVKLKDALTAAWLQAAADSQAKTE